MIGRRVRGGRGLRERRRHDRIGGRKQVDGCLLSVGVGPNAGQEKEKVVGDHLAPVGIDVTKDLLSISLWCCEICTKIHGMESKLMNPSKISLLEIMIGRKVRGGRGLREWRRHDRIGGRKQVDGCLLSVGVGPNAGQEKENGSLGF
ncbi:uncharacterized protein A4U43_C09F13820 [Asparagus officinalis]|uniref:Uncharacterized protein n=1 Tax=Asparagus officinalis TaxID=4686 RepID=A0A5P1E7H0_ASPOF|nr:uncharacterized protein A4U43_C09F13820 [Asparagus officinalis]